MAGVEAFQPIVLKFDIRFTVPIFIDGKPDDTAIRRIRREIYYEIEQAIQQAAADWPRNSEAG